MTRILVAGKSGQLACSLSEIAGTIGLGLTCKSPPELDLSDPAQTVAAVVRFKPDILINAAAYTAVDSAEDNPELAYAINATGTEALAIAAAELDIPFLHVSTDYVYAGDLERPYRETDETRPTGIYGASKLAGETAALRAHAKTAIFRTAWVFSPYGKNFVKTMLWLANNRNEVGIVADQFGNPTFALEIARTLLKVVTSIMRDGWREDYSGIFHLSGTGSTSWHGFASEIFRLGAAAGLCSNPETVSKLKTEEYPTPAKRPANSRLDCQKLSDTFDIRLPAWQSSLKNCIEQLKEQV